MQSRFFVPPCQPIIHIHRHIASLNLFSNQTPIPQGIRRARHTHTCVIQAITGHGFVGAYYHLFLPDHPSSCPCGTSDIQFRLHILSESPLYEEHRHLLLAASQDLSPSAILRTHKGLTALAKFIDASNAFGKS
ncbi:hypothetical protein BU17DRAFT_47654 [Hysterangium stoloniferum]|nr:hypothetical protein BU17DRAFT_47654 [Hysterangium stoloniferum]